MVAVEIKEVTIAPARAHPYRMKPKLCSRLEYGMPLKDHA